MIEMVSEKQIADFLFSALSESWAKEDVVETNPFPKLKLIKSESGDWRYVDQYVGGEPFQGFEVVWFKDVPIWSMTYRGRYKGREDYKLFLKFLKTALMQMPKDAPYRGPSIFESAEFAGWKYENKWNGKIKEFNGKEKISVNNKIVYQARYQGGIVNNDFANI